MHLQAKRAVNFGGSRTWADVSLVDLGAISSQLRRDLDEYIKSGREFSQCYSYGPCSLPALQCLQSPLPSPASSRLRLRVLIGAGVAAGMAVEVGMAAAGTEAGAGMGADGVATAGVGTAGIGAVAGAVAYSLVWRRRSTFGPQFITGRRPSIMRRRPTTWRHTGMSCPATEARAALLASPGADHSAAASAGTGRVIRNTISEASRHASPLATNVFSYAPDYLDRLHSTTAFESQAW